MSTLTTRRAVTTLLFALAAALSFVLVTAPAAAHDPGVASVEHGHELPNFGTFTSNTDLTTPGVHVATFSGGTIGHAQGAVPLARVFWAQDGNRWVPFVVGGPSAANERFLALFPGGQIPAGTELRLVTTPAAAAGYEVWALDQGTRQIHIIGPDFTVTDVIDLDGVVTTPHMVDFTSDHRYAFVANTGSGDVAVIRTADRQVIEVIPTGATAHMAAVVPGDEAVIVANIGAGTLTEILLDLDNEVFTIGRELKVEDDPLVQARASEFPGTSPVCHQYTADGRYAYVTLGPALANGGLVILDTVTFELVRVYSAAEIPVNCGTALSADGTKMYVNGGSLDAGEWFVFDTATHDLIKRESSRGLDAHGVRVTPDGSELWMVNRATSNGIIIDTATDEVIEELPFVGESPDIMDFSPDGRFIFITLRGPNPLSGPHAIAGDTPGVAIFDVKSREFVRAVLPDLANEASDFHGIGVRVTR
jgi:YVTN family beta-propeller protein